MDTLIVWFSLNGNTEYAVGKIKEAICADDVRLVPVKTYPDKGFRKFLVGGGDVVSKKRPELEPYSVDPAKYERIIFATPVWASSYAPPIGTFVNDNLDSLKDKRIACVFCSAGGGAEKAVKKLRDALGIDSFEAELSLVDPKTRPKDEDNALIEAFVDSLNK